MLAYRERRLVHIVPIVGCVLALLAGSGPAFAEQVSQAPDGLTFQSQSQATRGDFTATFGPTCAPQEWVWQHSITVDSDLLDGPPSSDGQKLADQDDDVQLAFVALFGPQANVEWLAERNAFVAHHVLLSAAAPMPCPPARSSAPAAAIGTTHLSDAVEAAKNGEFAGAHDGFVAFQVIWTAARPNVTQRSPTLAQGVQTAIDQVSSIVVDPKAPSQAQYYPALQNLLKVVRATNATLASGGAPTPAAAAVVGTAPQIKANNLSEAVEWASKDDLSNSRKEFGEFQDDWAKVDDAVRAAAPATADAIDRGIGQLSALIGDTSKSPTQAQYYPALQNLLKVVQDANASAAH